MLKETETFCDALIPETEVVPEDLLHCDIQAHLDTQHPQNILQETQLLEHDAPTSQAHVVGEQHIYETAQEGAQPPPPPQAEHRSGQLHGVSDVQEDAQAAAQLPEQAQQEFREQSDMHIESGTACQPITTPLRNKADSSQVEDEKAEQPASEAAVCIRAENPEVCDGSLPAAAESPAAARGTASQPCGVIAVDISAEQDVAQCKQQFSLPEKVPDDDNVPKADGIQDNSSLEQLEEEERAADEFDLEAVQFTAAAATQGNIPRTASFVACE